LRKGIVRPPL